MRCTILTILTVMLSGYSFAQQNRIRYNNQDLFLSGANLAWRNFANDIGPAQTDYDHFADVMLQMHDNGGNALRWWLHTNGTASPAFDASGVVTGPGSGTITDLKTVLDLAWEREIGVILCLWSFDMMRSSNSPTVKARNRNLLTDTAYTHAYINNSLIPMVDSLKGHPAIIAWEIFNEPEGMANEFGFNGVVNPDDRVPMSAIQRFTNLLAGAIHRTDSTALVSNGSWSFRASTNVQTPGGTNKNYYSDSELIVAGGDQDGTLDFYMVHYYSGIYPTDPTSLSPFHRSADFWQLDKPLVVGEFAMHSSSAPPTTPADQQYSRLLQTGYAGALAWSWTDINLSTHAEMLAGMKSLWDNYRDSVDVLGIGGDWPIVSITSPTDDSSFAAGAQVKIVAEASDADGTVTLVEFFANDTLTIGEATAQPYSVTWTSIPNGSYTLTAVATDNDGHQRTSASIQIQVGSLGVIKREAEAATRQAGGGGTMTVRSDVTASAGNYVDMALQSGTVTWTINNLSPTGTYELGFGYRLAYDSPKTQFINVNGTRVGEIVFDGPSSGWREKKINAALVNGTNTIQMELSWGWMHLDYLSLPSAVITSVDVSTDPPAVFSLEQNYPNPFNPVTYFKFQIPEEGIVKLAVYDVLGRELATLVHEEKQPGEHIAQWDATNFPSGLYLYQLEAGSFTSIKKMVLLK